ncbi:MAG: lysine--tRNA ligase, partial [Methylococcales bacterium]|nr:lysine--tRNA ligase [Methylococcales bacterium]
MSDTQPDEQIQITQRREKLSALRKNNIAFPTDFRRDSLAKQLSLDHGDKTKEALEENPVKVNIAGRLMTRRIMGKASFAHIQDMSGKIQLYVTRDTLAEGFYNTQFKKWDIGDIIGAEGVLFKTKVGEL